MHSRWSLLQQKNSLDSKSLLLNWRVKSFDPLINEQLHALVVQLLADCRQVFLADELGTALALSGEAKLVVKSVLA